MYTIMYQMKTVTMKEGRKRGIQDKLTKITYEHSI